MDSTIKLHISLLGITEIVLESLYITVETALTWFAADARMRLLFCLWIISEIFCSAISFRGQASMPIALVLSHEFLILS